MRKSMKKLCAVALTAAMAGSLVACGGGGSTTSTTAAPAATQAAETTAAAAETTAAAAGEETMAAAAEETAAPEETYDFGGATVRVSGGIFGDLNEENSANASYVTKWDMAHQVEEKYNIKFEYTKLEGDDGYTTMDAILAGITNGEAYADIFCQGDDIVVGLRDYLADITDTIDELQIGSIYSEAGTWAGHTYGWTYDNMGSVYVMAYSRDYLDSIGMDTTPTDMFEQGKWSYDDCIEYLTELKSKLPDGTYPISVHPNHWVAMAPAANGVVSVDSDGNIHLADEPYASSLEFYKQLLQLGLAAPFTGLEIDAESGAIGADMPYGTNGLSAVGNPGTHVMTMVEAWQMEGLQSSIGDWGIVPWPWDPNYVTCSGDYTTLSDTYKTAQAIWTDVLVPKAEYRAAGAKDIPDIVLHKIAQDFVDLTSADGAAARLKMYEAEKNGETYVNMGYTPGTAGAFSTEQDVAIYDWLHSRVVCDWGHSMNSNSIVRVNRNAMYVIGNGDDARSSGESYKAAGDQAMKDQGFK